MALLYFDTFSGISGDMTLGALIDIGVPFEFLDQQLKLLPIGAYHLHMSRCMKGAIAGVKFDVHIHDHHNHHDHASHLVHHDDEHLKSASEHDHEGCEADAHNRHHHEDHDHESECHGEERHDTHEHGHNHKHGRSYAEIKAMIQNSPYSDWVKSKADSIFARIARAEGKIHGRSMDEVHFHEVGAVDSIIDIVGTCLALEYLDKPAVMSAPIVDGHGWIQCAHGHFPLPAPATLAILGEQNIPLTQCDEPHELVTPTGAAILAEFATRFGPMDQLIAQKIGYGLGTRNLDSRPNVLRVIYSEFSAKSVCWDQDTVSVIESNLDDISGEILGNFFQIAFDAGALDVFYTPIHMKKNRPAVILTVLCQVAQTDHFCELILRQTSAFGVRCSVVERRKLFRESKVIDTSLGKVNVKVGKIGSNVIKTTPEFESCKVIAEKEGRTLLEVYEIVNQSIISGGK